MESIQSKLSVSAMTAYFGIIKEPRGLIRLLQFVFAICAFATACNGGSSIGITNTVTTETLTGSWSYPYNLQNSHIKFPNASLVSISSANDIKPSAEFFVFTGVTSMLISLAFLVIYILFDRQYRNDERLPLVDFVLTIIWMIFWLAGSAAWAKGVSNIRSLTDWEDLSKRFSFCSAPQDCQLTDSPGYGNLIVSVIFGFLNFILWIGAAWFIYKETKFFKGNSAQQQQQQQTQNQPTFTDFGSPNIRSESEIR